MKHQLNPRWLLLVNTLPVLLLMVLFFKQYQLIQSLLSPFGQSTWLYLGFGFVILGVLTLVMILFLMFKDRKFTKYYAIAMLILYTSYLYLFGAYESDLIPFSVPGWMLLGNIMTYFGSFLLPTIFYALLVLVYEFSQKAETRESWVNFVLAIVIPVSAYLIAQLILPLWQSLPRIFYSHTRIVFSLALILVSLFFLLRGMYVVAVKRQNTLRRFSLFWKIPFALIFPILGLTINNGHSIDDFLSKGSGIFGDFSSIWFYLLTVLNALFLCLPKLDHFNYRLLLFLGKSITFVYTLYFFLIFLPMLPLSVVLIVYIGFGILMLTPLVLFVIHLVELKNDYAFLKKEFTSRRLIATFLLGFLVIPSVVSLNFLRDRWVLHTALDYLYNPDYSQTYSINQAALSRVMNEIKYHKERNWGEFIFLTNTPYLSSYYNWLVLDNLTLSGSKSNTIENVFFGHSDVDFWSRESTSSGQVEIANIRASSSFDETQQVWKTWVDLELTNTSESPFAEYATTIELPDGCWISDYYLYVENVKEYGLLAEKKAATWVYSQIRNENRDPGILYYLTGNRVAFRVFPFAKDEVRKTGIEFLHIEPLQLKMDNQIIQFGDTTQSLNQVVETENMVYVPALIKQQLKKVNRTPYFHFLVDVSQNQKTYIHEFSHLIELSLNNHPKLAENAKISFVNSYVQTEDLSNDWKEAYRSQKFQGGFYLDRAIRQNLSQSRNQSGNPVFVVVSLDLNTSIMDRDFADLQFTFPESDVFYRLGREAQLIPHSLINNPKQELVDRTSLFAYPSVLAYPLADKSIVYLADNEKPSLVLKKEHVTLFDSDIDKKNGLTALDLQAHYWAQVLHPESADNQWHARIKYSFKSKILTPETAYIVVENDAQKALLLKKQQEALAGKRALDLSDDTRSMSEPNLFLLTFLFILITAIYNNRSHLTRIALFRQKA